MLKLVHTVTGRILQTTMSVTVKYMTFFVFSSSIQVKLGEHNLASQEGTEQTISSSKVIRHSGYNAYTLDNDIMLIKLSKAATLNSYVNTVPLPTSCVATGTTCLISGWGNTLSSGSECSERMYSILRAWEPFKDLTIRSKQYRVKNRILLQVRPF